MKLRYLVLLAVAMVSLAFGRSVQPALAQTGNETGTSIIIGTGNGLPISGTGTPQPAPSQSGNQTVKFKNVALWVNPEYDDARLLVMLEGALDGAIPPVQVRFLVPTASIMYSAGSKDATGKYTGGPPVSIASDIPGWDEISYTLAADAAAFRVEYYDPSIVGQPDKTISYDFRTISPISNLNVFVQQPKKSTNFAVTPKGTPGIDGEGFTIYSSYYTNLTAEAAPLHFDIAYTRSATNPSISSGGGSNLGFIVGLILVVVIVGGGVLWAVKSRQPRYVPVRRAGGKQTKRSAKKSSQGNRFCPKCGEPTGASDKFCPSCGSKLRDAQ